MQNIVYIVANRMLVLLGSHQFKENLMTKFGLLRLCQMSLVLNIRNQMSIFCYLMQPKNLLRLYNANHAISERRLGNCLNGRISFKKNSFYSNSIDNFIWAHLIWSCPVSNSNVISPALLHIMILYQINSKRSHRLRKFIF